MISLSDKTLDQQWPPLEGERHPPPQQQSTQPERNMQRYGPKAELAAKTKHTEEDVGKPLNILGYVDADGQVTNLVIADPLVSGAIRLAAESHTKMCDAITTAVKKDGIPIKPPSAFQIVTKVAIGVVGVLLLAAIANWLGIPLPALRMWTR
jgi:hypothetical protein